MAERKKIGDLLVEAGLIDKFQIDSALAHQRSWGGKLGTILIDMGFVRESEIAQVLSEKLRIPYEDLFQQPIDATVLSLLKPELAQKHRVMPVRKDGRFLVLAMSDPLDIDAMDEVRFITGLSVKPALAMESEIEDAIRKYYCNEEIAREVKATIQERLRPPSDGREAVDGTARAEGRQSAWERPDAQRDEVPDRQLLDALISLMLEKQIISEDDLQKMIELKNNCDFDRTRG